jgi:glutathione synthase/RimK-type ligase-like ATP-grasp enzyme
MPRCAFLTLEDPTGYTIDDELAYPALHAIGWGVDAVPWTRAADWRAYAAVVIRSTWDYVDQADRFLHVLEEIERTGVPLLNGLELVRWNLRKTYLRDLQRRGVPIVPTVWRDRLQPGELAALFHQMGAAEMVVKPVVGANAAGAFRLDEGSVVERAAEEEAFYADRPLMAQPFVPAVTAEGEFSLFYFNGEHSHTILKTPRPADFRVQEEHGALIRPAVAEDALRAADDAALRAIGDAPLYARADFVRASDGSGFWMMEMELIEPALYFRMDSASPARFAAALQARVG